MTRRKKTTPEDEERTAVDSLIDSLIGSEDDELTDALELTIHVAKRDEAGRIYSLTSIGIPPSDKTLTEWLLHIFGGGRFVLRFMAKGKTIAATEIDLRHEAPKDPPPGGWDQWGRPPEQLDEPATEPTRAPHEDSALLSLVQGLKTELGVMRQERVTLLLDLREERRQREEERRQEMQRQHEMNISLITGKMTSAAAPPPETPSSRLSQIIEERLVAQAADSFLGVKPATGDDEGEALSSGDGAKMDPIARAVEAFGARVADRMLEDGDDDDDGDEGPDENGEAIQVAAAEARRRNAQRAALQVDALRAKRRDMRLRKREAVRAELARRKAARTAEPAAPQSDTLNGAPPPQEGQSSNEPPAVRTDRG